MSQASRSHENDLGGRDILSEGQRTILRRIAMLELQPEMLETRFAQNEGEASAKQLELYQRTAGALRRLLESVGLNEGRKAKDISTIEYERDEEFRQELIAVLKDDNEQEARP